MVARARQEGPMGGRGFDVEGGDATGLEVPWVAVTVVARPCTCEGRRRARAQHWY
jgi:hypothetical protein